MLLWGCSGVARAADAKQRRAEMSNREKTEQRPGEQRKEKLKGGKRERDGERKASSERIHCFDCSVRAPDPQLGSPHENKAWAPRLEGGGTHAPGSGRACRDRGHGAPGLQERLPDPRGHPPPNTHSHPTTLLRAATYLWSIPARTPPAARVAAEREPASRTGRRPRARA